LDLIENEQYTLKDKLDLLDKLANASLKVGKLWSNKKLNLFFKLFYCLLIQENKIKYALQLYEEIKTLGLIK
jgi:hypothetical protein